MSKKVWITFIIALVFPHSCECLFSLYMCHIWIYLCVCSASVATTKAWVASSVLQTEAGFVSLCYLTASVYIQQIIEAECIHAVVMPVKYSQS